MSNNRPRRAGPVWLWALVLLVILITLFVLLRRDAAAQDADGYRQSYAVINKDLAISDRPWVEVRVPDRPVSGTFGTLQEAARYAWEANVEDRKPLE